MSRWYRRYAGTVSDPKIAEAALIAECSKAVVIATWDMILESAAETNEAGAFRATSRNVAATLGEQTATIDRVFAALENLEMIENCIVLAWSKRQFQSDSSTERSKKHRASKKENGNATPMQRCATPPDTETDTDTEGDSLPSSDSSAARGRQEGIASLKENFNGSTEAMLADVQSWMGPTAQRANAVKWLSGTLTAYGRQRTLEGWNTVTAKFAANELVPSPLPLWSKTAAGMRGPRQKQSDPTKKTVSQIAAERVAAKEGVSA